MTFIFDKRILITAVVVIGLGLTYQFYHASQTTALPDRPPTFDEIMKLSSQGRAHDSLVNSYIYGQDYGVGIEPILTLAETGDTNAELMACYLLAMGIGVKKDDARGHALCEKAAAKGSANAKANLIYRDFNYDQETMNWSETYDAFAGMLKSDPGVAHLGLQFLYRQDHPKASMPMMFHHLDKAIKHNNTLAMIAMSEFDLGIYPERYRNPERAERNLNKAYALNDFDAGHRLALEYRDGNLIEQNVPLYETMIKRMAAFRHPASMGELAYMHTVGKGAELDEDKAHALHTQAAEYGFLFSQEMIGYHFLSSPVDSPDYKTGVRYIEAQAKSGNIKAMTVLSDHYAKTEIDDPMNQHVAWLAEAAIQGHEASQERLGFGMMETGYIEAMQPYIQALEALQKQGHPDASFLLARHYRAASGVKRDLRKAQEILNAVAHLNNPRVIEEIDVLEGYIVHFGGIDAVPDVIDL